MTSGCCCRADIWSRPGVWLVLVPLLVAVSISGCTSGGPAELRVDSAWSRPASSDVGAVYLSIDNATAHVDRLLSASSAAARAVEIHHTVVDGDRMRMQPVEDGVTLPAHTTLEFAPGGYHVMLIGLHAPLVAGERFELTLIFERAGSRSVTVSVGPR